MRLIQSSVVAAASFCLCVGIAASPLQRSSDETRRASDVITVTGCVQKESAYRSAVADGKGGTLGSGVGAANEYVLRFVRTVSSETLKPTSMANRTFEEVYAVTGDLEREFGKAVGHQVAMSGYVEVVKSDGTAKVKDLPNFKASGWHTVSAKCTVPPTTK